MNEEVLTYKVNEIPDPFFPGYLMESDGDVQMAAASDFEHVLRPIAGLQTGSASLAIRYIFTPDGINRDPQSRLGIYVIARTQDGNLKKHLNLLLENGPLNRFYNLDKVERVVIPWNKLQACCEIIRREGKVNPLHSPEFNDRIPSFYYTIEPFIKNDRNNYLDLDRVLDGIKETAIIDICIEPANASDELQELTRYLSRLQSINRTWDHDEDADSEIEDYFGDGAGWGTARKKQIKPLRYSDPLAEDILHSLQKFHETLRLPNLLFRITVFSQSPSVAQLLGSIVAESSFEEGRYRILSYKKNEKSFDELLSHVKKISVSALSVRESLLQGKRSPLYSAFERLSHLATVDELLGVFRLPVSTGASPKFTRKNTDPKNIPEQPHITLGRDYESSGVVRIVHLDNLPKHGFISGGPGSGKTNSTLNICLQLNGYGIPFLVIEPVKTEYRILKTLRDHQHKNACNLSETLEIYTPGNESISPFRFNPLELLSGISVDEHIDNILYCFKAAIPLEGSLPALLGEALERIYENHPERDKPPTMIDLVNMAECVLAEKNYSPDTNSDFRAAIQARLGVMIRLSVGRVFQCRHSVPQIDHLMKVPAIIEFDRLQADQASLSTLFLLTGVRERLKTMPKSQRDPRYVIIIEEAHNLVTNVGPPKASPDNADPKAFASEYVTRMLAELRALGVAIIIIDQIPSAVAPEVIKNTTTKLAFRQVDKEDRDIISASILLNPPQSEELARLSPGEAFLYTEDYYQARRIKTINLTDHYELGTDVNNEKICAYLRDDSWFKNAADERSSLELAQLREQMDLFEDRRLQILEDTSVLISQYPNVLANPIATKKKELLWELMSKAKGLDQELRRALHDFIRKSYNKYIPLDGIDVRLDNRVETIRNDLITRFKTIIEPDVHESRALLKDFIRRCQETDDKEV